MKNVDQPLSLIVGGSSGMGLATARLLLERDIKTVIVGKSKEKLEAAKRTLSAFGDVEILQANLYEANDVRLDCAYWIDVGKTGHQGDAFLCLFDGQSWIARTHATHGNGAGGP